MNVLERFTILLFIGGAIYIRGERVDRPVRPTVTGACSTQATSSRWAGRTYVRTATYGQDESNALGWIVGVARSPRGHIAVYDAARSRIVVLGPGLTEQGRFGRPGGGVGLAAIPHPISIRGLQWIASDSMRFHVYTPDRIIQFDTSGTARSMTPVGWLMSSILSRCPASQ